MGCSVHVYYIVAQALQRNSLQPRPAHSHPPTNAFTHVHTHPPAGPPPRCLTCLLYRQNADHKRKRQRTLTRHAPLLAPPERSQMGVPEGQRQESAELVHFLLVPLQVACRVKRGKKGL